MNLNLNKCSFERHCLRNYFEVEIEEIIIKGKILIIGQIPPPYHGSNIMAKTMILALSIKKYESIFINKKFSKSLGKIGKISLKKLLRVPVLAIEIFIACMFQKPLMCIYFISVGKSALIIDALFTLIFRLCKIPYILRFGGKGYRKLQSENFFWKFIVSLTLSNAFGGIVLGRSMKWDINMCIPNDRLVYVPNGIAKNNNGIIRENKKYIQILYLSNLVPSKGPLEFIKAAKIVTQTQSNVHFILAGDNSSLSFTKKIKSYIKSNSLDKFITMQERVYGEKKDKLFAKSDIFVFPTYFHLEVFGTVNIEAMSWGLPVITSNEGAIPEIVQNGVTGFIVNPRSPEEIADKILYLFNNPEIRQEMGKKGKEIFNSKFTIEAHAKHLDRAIRFFDNKLKTHWN